MKQLSIKRKGSISPGVQASKQCRLVEDDTEGKFPVVTFYCVFTLFLGGGGGGGQGNWSQKLVSGNVCYTKNLLNYSTTQIFVN